MRIEDIHSVFPDWREYFWQRVDISDGCWMWLGGRSDEGYGRVKIGGRRYVASRIAYLLIRGEVPDDLNVCHTCDNPGCVNPAHLFLGDDAANHRDRDAKGRGRWVTRDFHPLTKLPSSAVSIVKEMAAAGMTQSAIAEHFGVSQTTVWRVIHSK